MSEHGDPGRPVARSEREYEALVHSIDGIVWEAEASPLRFTFVSRQAEEILGYPASAWVEDPDFWPDHIHPEDRSWVLETCSRESAKGRDHEFEYRMIAADGRTIWFHDRVRVVRDEGGTFRLLGVMIDITEAKQAERALSRRDEEYRALVELAPFGIFRSTPDGRILSANPELVRILGYDSVDEVLELDLPIDVYADRSEREEISNRVEDVDLLTSEATWKRADGDAIDVRMKTRVVRSPDGSVRHYETFVEDVTEQRELEAQLRRSQRMESLGRLSGGIAHDFNNILTAILGDAELLLDTLDPDDDGRREAAEIRGSAERAARLTRQLLAFSRRQVLQPRAVALNDLVRRTEHMLGRLLTEDIELVTKLEPELRPVRADPGQIEQVIVNLAVNARDAMPEGGRLTVETRNVELSEADAERRDLDEPGRYILLAVSDTGEGMDPETASQIFDPFFTTKGEGEGTGLGLATVYGIVSQSDGHVRVRTAADYGATFEIYLPEADEEPEPVPRDGRTEVDAAARGETVLLVEDDEAVRRIALRALKKHGYRTLEAGDGEAALALAEDHDGRIDLLVSDMVLPGVDGLVVAEKLREAHPELKLLFVSGYGYDVARAHPLAAEASFLPKPFTVEDLARKVRKALDR